MIPFYLVTGFLGSGKTTLLKHLLGTFSESERVAVIQNEFAPAGTDGEILKLEGKPFRLVEINNGSVFCVCQMGNFIEMLDKLVTTCQPDVIFLEASGLSDPVNIIELLQDKRIRGKVGLEGTVAIVDAVNFTRAQRLLPRTSHQVMIADLVLLNKTDLPGADVPVATAGIKKINPYARIFPTSYCALDPAMIRELGNATRRPAFFMKERQPGGRPDIPVAVLNTNKPIDAGSLEALVREWSEAAIRIKGFVNITSGEVRLIQCTFGTYQEYVIDHYAGPTEIIVFGGSYTARDLQEAFGRYAG
ncbi:MAG: GTP-binding protein [Bacteroidales bacterium]|nr:GTP-binding protein [Bacteroidales bacterium]MDT8431376.1 GTP-binding protein [Bacteroidales bacterium]